MPCVRLVTLLEVQGKLDDFELLDIEDDDDIPKIMDILEKNPEVIDDASPECVIENDDGSYGPCNIDSIWEDAESIIPRKNSS